MSKGCEKKWASLQESITIFRQPTRSAQLRDLSIDRVHKDSVEIVLDGYCVDGDEAGALLEKKLCH